MLIQSNMSSQARHLLLLVMLGGTAACSSSNDHGAITDGGSDDPTSALVGTWNYDQPNLQTGLNVGRIICPSPDGGALAPIVAPQIGYITLTKTGERTIEGATDQGCTWKFAVQGDTANLDPEEQTCQNPTIATSYTLKWSMKLDGMHETEVITGKSHLPNGDCDFRLEEASRTKVDPTSSVDPTTQFVGAWSYTPPDSMTGMNVEQITCPSPSGGAPTIDWAPQFGTIVLTKSGEHTIEGKTDQGCAWTFDVRGNTAELAPPAQSCSAADGSSYVLDYFAIASDGQHEAEWIAGKRTDASGVCDVLLTRGTRLKE